MFEMLGDVCHICGHPGAGEADHVIPLGVDPSQPISPFNMRPAHGVNAPCPTCGRKCNQERGMKAFELRFATSRDW